MKITLPSFLLLFILTTAINAQQKIGFKIILDQNFKYTNYGDGPYRYTVWYYKWNSKSYGFTYEKALSNKFLTSIESGLYLNNQASSVTADNNITYPNTDKIHTNYFSDNEFHAYTLEKKITELHIPILIKKYFYIKSTIFFVSAGPKLALTLSDKTSYIDDTKDKSILMKRNNFDFVHSSRFYLINTLQINLGFEYKKVQISTSFASTNIRNLHDERYELDYYLNYHYKDSYIRKANYSANAFLLSLSIGYTL